MARPVHLPRFPSQLLRHRASWLRTAALPLELGQRIFEP